MVIVNRCKRVNDPWIKLTHCKMLLFLSFIVSLLLFFQFKHWILILPAYSKYHKHADYGRNKVIIIFAYRRSSKYGPSNFTKLMTLGKIHPKVLTEHHRLGFPNCCLRISRDLRIYLRRFTNSSLNIKLLVDINRHVTFAVL